MATRRCNIFNAYLILLIASVKNGGITIRQVLLSYASVQADRICFHQVRQCSSHDAALSREITRACVVTGQGSYIKTSSGRAVRWPNVHRLLAAMKRRNFKGMSVATADSGIC